MELRETQYSVLEAIKKFIKNYGYSPSIREICFLTDKSPATIHYHLKRLKEDGYLDYKNTCRRTLTLTEKGIQNVR